MSRKNLEALFEKLSHNPKQESIVLKYLQEVPVFSHPELNASGFAKNKLLGDELSASSLNTLIKNKILEEYDIVVPRFGFDDAIVLTEQGKVSEGSAMNLFLVRYLLAF